MSGKLFIGAALSVSILVFPGLAPAQYWDVETIDAAAESVGLYSSLALDGNGNPHISYYDTTGDNLKYAWYDGAWHVENVDTTGDVGSFSSLALDGDGRPHISYYAATNTSLKYARREGAWHTETVDNTASVGQDSSIALTSSGNPCISYYNATSDNLKYAWYDGVWHLESVDTPGNVGLFCSLALGSNNRPHISYYDQTNFKLKYAHYDGVWNSETVDTGGAGGDVGLYCSLALDGNGRPHISYYDNHSMDLKYAHYNGAWHLEVADGPSNIGQFSSIALDSSDNPHISYYSVTGGNLKYARYDGSWHAENVDTLGNVGLYTSLALDGNDNPRISYYDDTNDNLKYARWVPAMPVATPTPPSYFELSVTGGPNFAAGDTLTLNWAVHAGSYGFAGSPRDVYLGVILSPESGLENRTATVAEVAGTSGDLLLFSPAISGLHAFPPARCAWRNVVFPLPGGDSGSLNFTVPPNVGQRCVFIGAFVPFPVADQCVVSNAFNLPPIANTPAPTPVSPSGRSGAFYLPDNYTQRTLPLLVAFHGSGGNGAGMVVAFQDLAAAHGFIIVAPDSGDPDVWWITEAGHESDDYPIIMQWVDYIRSYPGVTIDDTRVMTIGFSGGCPVAPYIATNDEQFTAFASMHGEVWEPSIGPNLACAWLSTGEDDWWTPAMFEGYANMLIAKGFTVTHNTYPGGHALSDEEKSAVITWWLQ